MESYMERDNQNYYPPYLGGIADDIFLTQFTYNRKKLGRKPYMLHRAPLQDCGSDRDKREEFVPWVRVKNVPPMLRMPMYKIFSKLGKLKCVRTYDACIYLLYEKAEQAKLALEYDQKQFPYKKIWLNPRCDYLTEMDIKQLDQEHNIYNYDYVNEIAYIYECDDKDTDSDDLEEKFNNRFTIFGNLLYQMISNNWQNNWSPVLRNWMRCISNRFKNNSNPVNYNWINWTNVQPMSFVRLRIAAFKKLLKKKLMKIIENRQMRQ